MRSHETSPFAPLPAMPDVVIVGAGAAGIGAARRLVAAGLRVAILEARDRVGGRAVTVPMRGHPIDLGAHWLHAGPINPLVHLGCAQGEPIRRAPVEGHLVIGRRRGSRAERAALDHAFDRADRALTGAAGRGPDRPAMGALPFLGPWRDPIARVHGLVSGRPLAEVSLEDFPSLEYADNRFIAGGLGAYLARLARGLPIALDTPVRAIDVSGARVKVETARGDLEAAAVLVTVPIAILQADAIRFTPALPAQTADAIGSFLPGHYEHVVLHWPRSPFQEPDRLATIVGGRRPVPGLLSRIDGTPFHYFELDHPLARDLGGSHRRAAAYVRSVLADHLGPRALDGLAVHALTDWARDPLARASWAVVPPGRAASRAQLREPVHGRVIFAGEALSREQWGTAGGAWEEGERAADRLIGLVRPQPERAHMAREAT